MEPELSGQESLQQNCQQWVGVHLVQHNELIIKLNGIMSIDQTGRFPIVLQKVNQYMMVLYNYDSNATLAEDCESRTVTEFIATYNILYNRLTKVGIVRSFKNRQWSIEDIDWIDWGKHWNTN